MLLKLFTSRFSLSLLVFVLLLFPSTVFAVDVVFVDHSSEAFYRMSGTGLPTSSNDDKTNGVQEQSTTNDSHDTSKNSGGDSSSSGSSDTPTKGDDDTDSGSTGGGESDDGDYTKGDSDAPIGSKSNDTGSFGSDGSDGVDSSGEENSSSKSDYGLGVPSSSSSEGDTNSEEPSNDASNNSNDTGSSDASNKTNDADNSNAYDSGNDSGVPSNEGSSSDASNKTNDTGSNDASSNSNDTGSNDASNNSNDNHVGDNGVDHNYEEPKHYETQPVIHKESYLPTSTEENEPSYQNSNSSSDDVWASEWTSVLSDSLGVTLSSEEDVALESDEVLIANEEVEADVVLVDDSQNTEEEKEEVLADEEEESEDTVLSEVEEQSDSSSRPILWFVGVILGFALMAVLFAKFLDNGIENKHHQEFGVKVYFCDPYASWQKGAVENINLRIRRFIPKGANLDDYSDEDIQKIEDWLNHTPRKCLNYKTPYEIMQEKVSTTMSIVRLLIR
jgi:hypothetical protein